MEVEYQLTADDLYAFHWRAFYTSPKSRRARRMAYLYLSLPILVIGLLPTIGPGGFRIARINVIFLIAVLPLLAGLYWVIERRMMRRAINALVKQERPHKGRLGRHKIVLADDGLVETTAAGETHTLWAGVVRVERNDDYIFIYTAPDAAHIIPRRAFSGSQAEEFYQLARSRTEQAEAAQSRSALITFATVAVLSPVLNSASEPPTRAQAEPIVLEAQSLIDVQRESGGICDFSGIGVRGPEAFRRRVEEDVCPRSNA